MTQEDKSIENLLDLDGIRYVIDDQLGLWVKFEAKKVAANKDRPHGMRYSLTLHDRFNKRIMGFDNAHAIEYSGNKTVAPRKAHDHWHRNSTDEGQPYTYINAGKLIEDFWKEVGKIHKQLEETRK